MTDTTVGDEPVLDPVEPEPKPEPTPEPEPAPTPEPEPPPPPEPVLVLVLGSEVPGPLEPVRVKRGDVVQLTLAEGTAGRGRTITAKVLSDAEAGKYRVDTDMGISILVPVMP